MTLRDIVTWSSVLGIFVMHTLSKNLNCLVLIHAKMILVLERFMLLFALSQNTWHLKAYMLVVLNPTRYEITRHQWLDFVALVRVWGEIWTERQDTEMLTSKHPIGEPLCWRLDTTVSEQW